MELFNGNFLHEFGSKFRCSKDNKANLKLLIRKSVANNFNKIKYF